MSRIKLIILLLSLSIASQASESDDSGAVAGGPQSPSPEIVKAWAKAGSEHSWTCQNDVNAWQYQKDYRSPRSLFTVTKLKNDFTIATLPDPKVPFGIWAIQYGKNSVDLRDIHKQKNLRSLDIYDSLKMDEQMQDISRIEQLEHLSIVGNLTEAGLKEIGKLKNLRTLSIGSNEPINASFEIFGKLENLETLSMSLATNKTTDILKSLKSCKKLKGLNFNSTTLLDADMKLLSQLPQLEELNLQHATISLEGIKELKGLKNLKSLNILLLSEIGDEGCQFIAQSFPKLRNLTFGDNSMTTKGIKLIAKMPHLEKVCVAVGVLEPEAFEALMEIPKLTHFSTWTILPEGWSKTLAKRQQIQCFLSNKDTLRDDDLDDIIKLENLDYLSFAKSTCKPETILKLGQNKNLRILIYPQKANLSEEMSKQLKKDLPNCMILTR